MLGHRLTRFRFDRETGARDMNCNVTFHVHPGTPDPSRAWDHRAILPDGNVHNPLHCLLHSTADNMRPTKHQ